MQASQLLSLVNHALNDPGNDAYSEATKLLALSEAMEIISTIDPGCYVVTGNIDLVEGPYQTLPTGGIRLLGLYYNTGADGNTVGRSIKFTTREQKNATSVTWPSTTGTAVSEYMYDHNEDPLSFIVIPNLTAATKVHGTFSKVPPAMTSSSDTFPLKDTYRTPTVEFALYRLLTRDDVGTDNYRRGMGHYNNGAQLIGARVASDDVKDMEIREPVGRR